MCEKCESKKAPKLWTTPGAGTMLDNEEGDAYHEFDSITMWANVCPDCMNVVDKGFDD